MLPQAGQGCFAVTGQLLGLSGGSLSLAQFAGEQGQHRLAFALTLGLNPLKQCGLVRFHGEARAQIGQFLARILVGGAQFTHVAAERFGAAALLYFAMSYPLSRWSLALERKLNASRR